MLLFLVMEKISLELFSGSKTVSTILSLYGFTAYSIDNNPRLNPSILADILKLDINFLPGNVGFIWASPDCSRFSRAGDSSHWKKTTFKYRQYRYDPLTAEAQISAALLQKTVDIINHYTGVLFVIENPIGRIHHMPSLKNLGHYRYAVNYADFGFPYSKETYLFTNLFLPFSTKKVYSSAPGLRTVNNRYQRSKVPPDLVHKIVKYLPL